MVRLVLLVVAVICFAAAALRVKTPVDLTNAGFAFVTASLIV